MTGNPLSICNRALTEIARGSPMASGDVSTNFDGSATGIYCATLYPGAVSLLLRTQDWEFSRRALALTATGATPPLGWSQEYPYPNDCFRVRQIVPPMPLADPYDPQPVRWDVGDVSVTGIIGDTIALFNGAGYAVGDTGTIVGGTGTVVATYIVNTVAAGAVLTYTITNRGNGYSGAAYNTAVGGSQPGGGSGFVIDVITLTFTATRVIWTNQASATLLYSTSFITEAEFDPGFTEQLVRYLGSILAMPVAGRPDFSKEMLDVAGRLGAASLDRDS